MTRTPALIGESVDIDWENVLPDPPAEKPATESSLLSQEPESTLNQDALLGTTLDGRIEIISVLGRGGCGVVYKGLHLALQNMVAVKVLDLSVGDDEISTRRFVREAQLLSSFQHENIVKFQSFGSLSDGRYYMVLEFLEGETLAQLLNKSGALESKRALELFIQICQGLAYAHEKAVIHRDLKPANVMICSGQEGEYAKLLDFGIFKSTSSGNQSLTQTGSVVGTVNYMSPEQCKMSDLDARSDIYSLGVLMYEALVGNPPMQAETDLLIMSNQLNKIIAAVPAKLGLSAPLEKVIVRCLVKDKGARFASADELLPALKTCRTADTKKKTMKFRPVVVLALVITVIGIFVFLIKNKPTKPSQEKSQFKGQHAGRPPNIHMDCNIDIALPDELKWIKVAVNDRAQQASEIAGVYIRCAKTLKTEIPPCSREIIERLKNDLKNHVIVGDTQRIEAQGRLIEVLVISGEYSAALKELRNLAEAKNMARYTKFRHLLHSLLSEAFDAKRPDEAEKIVDLYREYAVKRGSDLDLGLSLLHQAELYLNDSRLVEARASADQAFEKLFKLQLSESDLQSLLELLGAVGRHKKAIQLVEKYFPENLLLLSNDKQNLVTGDQKNLAAIAFMNVGNFAKSRKISSTFRDQSIARLDIFSVISAEKILLSSFKLQGELPQAETEAIRYFKTLKDKGIAPRYYLRAVLDIVTNFDFAAVKKYLIADLPRYESTEPALCQEIRQACQESSGRTTR